jgi:sec-independent protein translocase protein TatC
MFGLSPVGLVIMVLLALVIIGPKTLPAAVEGTWLAITNLRRQQRSEEPLSMDEARLIWKAERSPIYQLVEVLNAVVEHLEEMRGRIIKIMIAMGMGTVICLLFYNQLYVLLLKPIQNLYVPPEPGDPKSNPTYIILNQTEVITATLSLGTVTGTETLPSVQAQMTIPKGTTLSVDLPTQPQRIRPIFTTPTEMFTTTFKICVLGGFSLALPIVLYQVIAFVWPALIYERERRWVFIIIPLASVFFIVGILFCYFFLLPFALNYLLTFGKGIAVAMPNIGTYIGFVTTLMFWIGVVFETPLFVFFLAKLHIVSYQKLKSFWKYAFLIAFIVGAVITPTPDPFNQTLVALPIFLLYLLGLVFARFA